MKDSDVRKLASLARLRLSPEEEKSMAVELTSILGYVEQLGKIDVKGIEPMSHVHGSSNVYRDDTPVPPSDPTEMMQNAPDRSGRFIRVPLIIGE